MRDLDGRDLITGDFLLVSGDVVSNIDLEPILAKHRARRDKDKNSIMTIILREAGLHNHRKRSKGRKPVFIIDPKTERCLHYEEADFRSSSSHSISVDPGASKSHKEIELRGDLLDCYIDICTPDVLGLWSDNFDYSNLRSSFLHGVLKDYELNGKTIYTHITNDQYATRVRNVHAYDIVSKDILGRWTYHLCPDSNMLPGQLYHFEKGNIYSEVDVSTARTSKMERKVVLGRWTRVGERTLIADTTVGRNCQIGCNADISGSYIWDDVRIGDGTKVRRAIIASGARIGKNCIIEPGALVSFGAHVDDGTHVSGTSRVLRANRKDEDNDMKVVSQAAGASGSTTQAPSSDDDSDASSILGLSNSRASLLEHSISEFSESETDRESLPEISRRSSLRSDQSSDSAPNRDFHIVATADILEGLQNGFSAENISLELVGLRMKEDASQHQVRYAVVAAFMKRISNLMNPTGLPGLTAREAVEQVFRKYKELVRRTLFDQSEVVKGDQIDLLLLIQKDAVGRPQGEPLFAFIANELWRLGLVEAGGIIQWWDDDRSKHGELTRARPLVEPFIKILRDSDEGSEEESEEESD